MLINLSKWGKGERRCFHESFSFRLQKYVRPRADHNNKDPNYQQTSSEPAPEKAVTSY